MEPGLAAAVLATLVLWTVSAAAAVAIGLVLAWVTIHAGGLGRLAGEALITITRGVPTSLLVVIAGIIAGRLPPYRWVADVFPGTPPGLQVVAWAIVAALALSSAGHLAVIFRTAHDALGRPRIEAALVLGLPPLRRLVVLGREASRTALPPVGARLVHHLHNTAFAALFPVAELFGWVQDQANATFDVIRFAAIGAVAYVLLTAAIWVLFRTAEVESLVRVRRPRGAPAAVTIPRP